MTVILGGNKTTFQTTLTEISVSDIEGVGSIRKEAGKKYKWVQFDNGAGDIASVVGGAAGYLATDTGLHTVSGDVSGCFAGLLAGIFLSVVTDQYYCWIQIAGESSLVNDVTGTTPEVGDSLFLAGTTNDLDLVVDLGANRRSGGILLDTTTTAQVAYLTCPE